MLERYNDREPQAFAPNILWHLVCFYIINSMLSFYIDDTEMYALTNP